MTHVSNEAIADLAHAARAYVARATGIEPDGSEESLAIVDHYLTRVPPDRDELVALVAPAIGCYFGEVVRNKFGGRWLFDGAGPDSWRLEVDGITFSPMAMVVEAVRHGATRDHDAAAFNPPPAERDMLERALARTAPVTDLYYYSLTGRIETLAFMLEAMAADRCKGPDQESA